MKLADKLESESVTMPVNEYISNILTDMFFPVEIFLLTWLGQKMTVVCLIMIINYLIG